ncbi:MAG: glutamate racemase [Parachlamydiaceae bacterium]|nr:glutamate racemase [Parachlamydiaceae bacterium]
MHEKRSYHIGMFDSGVGGLTVMHQLMHSLPHESVIYFGDTARIPYGSKSQETIIRYSIENAIFLLEKNIKLLVVACNTASAFALERLRKIFNIPIIGVIEPGAEKACSVTRNRRLAVLGTKGTILSGAYQREISKRLPNSFVLPIACPLFVPLVEERFLDHCSAQMIVKEYLAPIKNQGIDTILLGCTHYPLLKHLIQQEVGPEIMLVDSASTCAEMVARILQQNNMETHFGSEPNYQYHVSDDPKKFKDQVEMLFGNPIHEVHGHAFSH